MADESEFSFKDNNGDPVTVTIKKDGKDKKKLHIKVNHKKKEGQGDDSFDISGAAFKPAPPPNPPHGWPPKPRVSELKGDGGAITLTCPQDDDDNKTKPRISLGPGSALVDSELNEHKQDEIRKKLESLELSK